MSSSIHSIQSFAALLQQKHISLHNYGDLSQALLSDPPRSSRVFETSCAACITHCLSVKRHSVSLDDVFVFFFRHLTRALHASALPINDRSQHVCLFGPFHALGSLSRCAASRARIPTVAWPPQSPTLCPLQPLLYPGARSSPVASAEARSRPLTWWLCLGLCASFSTTSSYSVKSNASFRFLPWSVAITECIFVVRCTYWFHWQTIHMVAISSTSTVPSRHVEIQRKTDGISTSIGFLRGTTGTPNPHMLSLSLNGTAKQRTGNEVHYKWRECTRPQMQSCIDLQNESTLR